MMTNVLPTNADRNAAETLMFSVVVPLIKNHLPDGKTAGGDRLLLAAIPPARDFGTFPPCRKNFSAVTIFPFVPGAGENKKHPSGARGV